VSHKAVHPHHHLGVSQIHQLIGCPCDNYRRHNSEEGAWQLPYTVALCQLTGRLQKGSECHDHGTRESDALVPLGLDHPITIYGDQRLEEREHVINDLFYRSRIAWRRVTQHNLYHTIYGFKTSARDRGPGRLCCLWQLSGKRHAIREPTAYRSPCDRLTAATLLCIKFAALSALWSFCASLHGCPLLIGFCECRTQTRQNYIRKQFCLIPAAFEHLHLTYASILSTWTSSHCSECRVRHLSKKLCYTSRAVADIFVLDRAATTATTTRTHCSSR
jgi:hypothetical protein